MMQQALSHWPYGTMSGIAALLFLSVFVSVLVRVMLKGKNGYAEAERLPLEEDRV